VAVSSSDRSRCCWPRYGVAVATALPLSDDYYHPMPTTPPLAPPPLGDLPGCDALGALAHAAQRPRRMIGVFVRRALMTLPERMAGSGGKPTFANEHRDASVLMTKLPDRYPRNTS
jgi:hypothetical protein